jgi:ribosomal protein L24E
MTIKSDGVVYLVVVNKESFMSLLKQNPEEFEKFC